MQIAEYKNLRNKVMVNGDLSYIITILDLFHITLPLDLNMKEIKYRFEENFFLIRWKNNTLSCKIKRDFYEVTEIYGDFITIKTFGLDGNKKPLSAFASFSDANDHKISILDEIKNGNHCIHLSKNIQKNGNNKILFSKSIEKIDDKTAMHNTYIDIDAIKKISTYSYLLNEPYYNELKVSNDGNEYLETVFISNSIEYTDKQMEKLRASSDLLLKSILMKAPVIAISGEYRFDAETYVMAFLAVKRDSKIIISFKGTGKIEEKINVSIDATDSNSMVSDDLEILLNYVKDNFPYAFASNLISEIESVKLLAMKTEYLKNGQEDILDSYFKNYKDFDSFSMSIFQHVDVISKQIDEITKQSENGTVLQLKG